MSPKGFPREWTLEELQTIWEFDGDQGQTTVTDAARGMGISHSHWYGLRARLQAAGGPQQLFDAMQDAKQHRYNRTSNGRVRASSKQPQTLEESVTRTYVIRVGSAGRGGQYQQFTVTIPPLLASAFVAAHGGLDVVWQPTQDGLLLKPAPRPEMPEIPAWLAGTAEDATT